MEWHCRFNSFWRASLSLRNNGALFFNGLGAQFKRINLYWLERIWKFYIYCRMRQGATVVLFRRQALRLQQRRKNFFKGLEQTNLALSLIACTRFAFESTCIVLREFAKFPVCSRIGKGKPCSPFHCNKNNKVKQQKQRQSQESKKTKEKNLIGEAVNNVNN